VVEAVAAADIPNAHLEQLPEGRFPDLDRGPFETDEHVFAYLDATAGQVMALAARRLDPSAVFEQVRGAARAFGLAGLWRSRRGRLPAVWTSEDLRARVDAELTAAGAELTLLPVAAFPAVAYASLARPYARGRNIGGVEKRIRLIVSVLRGRI
jgi:phytoene synthase